MISLVDDGWVFLFEFGFQRLFVLELGLHSCHVPSLRLSLPSWSLLSTQLLGGTFSDGTVLILLSAQSLKMGLVWAFVAMRFERSLGGAIVVLDGGV